MFCGALAGLQLETVAPVVKCPTLSYQHVINYSQLSLNEPLEFAPKLVRTITFAMLANSREVVEQEPFCADARSTAGMRLAQTSIEIQKKLKTANPVTTAAVQIEAHFLFWLHKHGRHPMAFLSNVVVRIFVDCVVIGSLAFLADAKNK